MRRQFIGGYHGVPNTANIPSVGSGEPIEAAHIFKLGKEIERNRVNNVKGAVVKRTTGGTVIIPLPDFDPSHPWRTYVNDDLVFVEIGHAYGSRTAKYGAAGINLFSAGRENNYTVPLCYDILCNIAGHYVNEWEHWTVSFPLPSNCNDWIVYLKIVERPEEEEEEEDEGEGEGGEGEEGEGEEDVPVWKNPDDFVAMLSIEPVGTIVPSGVPIAVIEAIRDDEGEPNDTGNPEDPCNGKKPFLFWNATQIARSDIALEKKEEIRRHPFEVYLTNDGLVKIEQGFVYTYPNGFVDTGIGIYPNAVKLGDTVAPETDGTENNPVNPTKPDGSAKTPEEIADEQAQKDAVKASKYLLNSNGQTFTVSEGDYIFLNFYRIDDGPFENPEEFLGWRCTLEIASTMTSNILNGQYNINMLGACNTDYPNCGPWTKVDVPFSSLPEGSSIVAFSYWVRWKNAKHVSSGNQAYPIAKIVDGKVVQFLRSDFFYYPPLDSSVSFPVYTFTQPPPDTTALVPSSGE